MKKAFVLFSGVFLLGLAGCLQQSEPTPTAIPSDTPTNSPTVTASATATQTPTPTPTPTLTPSSTATATITPTPTLTPLFQSAPERVDLSEPVHAGRPQLSGSVRFIDTDHFRIFYTMAGEDAVQVEDINGNAVPDYVEEVALALEHSWDVEILQLGWAEPPPDLGLGGDEKYDVYLEDLDMYIAGYVNNNDESSLIADNPRTDYPELTASFSYMGLDNDFAEIEELEDMDIALTGLEFMRTTVAHEFNHAIQFGHDSEEPHRWLWEATATWVETYVYEDIKDSNFHLKAAFKSADSCLLDYGGRDRVESAGHWYALWIFLRYMSEQLDVTIVRDIWRETIQYDGYEAFEAALRPYSTTLDEIYRGYVISLLLQNFEFELEYPTVRLEGLIEGIQSWAPNDGVGQMGADFIEIDGQGVVEISLWNLDQGSVLGIWGDQADIYHLEDAKTTINMDQYERVYLIVLNLARAEEIEDCKMTPYRVRVLSGEEAALPDETLSASSFKIPSVEPLAQPER